MYTVVVVYNDRVIHSPHVSMAKDGKMTSSGTVLGYDKSPKRAYSTALEHAHWYGCDIVACVKDGPHYLNITPENDGYTLTHCVFDVLGQIAHGSGQVIMNGNFVDLLTWAVENARPS